MFAKPYDFWVEGGTCAWFRGIPEGDNFEDEAERLATIPPHIFDANSGNFLYDPSNSSEKLYPTRAEAIVALLRATDPEPFVPDPVTIETGPG
jgi:hypothetical protein